MSEPRSDLSSRLNREMRSALLPRRNVSGCLRAASPQYQRVPIRGCLFHRFLDTPDDRKQSYQKRCFDTGLIACPEPVGTGTHFTGFGCVYQTLRSVPSCDPEFDCARPTQFCLPSSLGCFSHRIQVAKLCWPTAPSLKLILGPQSPVIEITPRLRLF
jgi:hypothetical protein